MRLKTGQDAKTTKKRDIKMITCIQITEDKHYTRQHNTRQETWYLNKAQHILEKMKIITKYLIIIKGNITREMGIAMKTSTNKAFLEERFAKTTLTEKM